MPNEAESGPGLVQTVSIIDGGTEGLVLTLLELRCSPRHNVVLKQTRDSVVHVELDPGRRTERAVSRDGDAVDLAKGDELSLAQIGVKLDLENLRLVLGIAENINEERAVDVADTDVASETFVDELLHRLVRLLVRGILELYLALAIVVPLGRVASFGVDILDGDGEVDLCGGRCKQRATISERVNSVPGRDRSIRVASQRAACGRAERRAPLHGRCSRAWK